MATTTPNFGWPVPTSTDLVKDGATAMEALGDAIDTSMVDLKGGTTGQILSKASSADMDFSWTTPNPGDITGITAGTGISGGGTSGDVTITNSMATAIDAKGDLIAGTAADTFSRLAVGTNGQVLTADSTASTGLAWATPSAGSSNVAGKNGVLNSAFNVWQRGTSISQSASTLPYTADRWQALNGANQANTISRQATGDTTNLPFIQYCARMQRNSGQTGTADMGLFSSFETVNSVAYAGKAVTLSFYARSGANFSATSNILVSRVYVGTGTDQNLLTGYTGLDYAGQSNTLTTTWQRFSLTLTIPAVTTEVALGFYYTPTGTASTNDYFEITGVQLEIASSASAYSPNTPTYATELAACQRYYYLHLTSASGGKAVGMGYYQSASQVRVYVNYPVTMRTTPSLVAASGTNYYQVVVNGAADGFNSFTINAAGETGSEIYNGSEVSGTAGQAAVCEATNASSSIAFSAEL